MYRKTLGKQATHRTPKGTEKQLDCILVDRKHIYCSRNAKANDMIHMGATTEVLWYSLSLQHQIHLTKSAPRQDDDEIEREQNEIW